MRIVPAECLRDLSSSRQPWGRLFRTLAVVGVVLGSFGASIVPAVGASDTGGGTPRSGRTVAEFSQSRSRADGVELKFDEAAEVTLTDGRFMSRTGYDLSAVNALVDAEVRTTRPLVPRPPAEIREARRASRQHGVATPDMASYFRLRLRPGTTSSVVSEELRDLGVVEAAYPEPVPAPPPATPSFTSSQAPYLGAAPEGLGISGVAGVAGIRGGNVTLADVEYSWNTAHEDLSRTRLPGAALTFGTPKDPWNDTNHGASVAGIVAADRNGFGVDGIVPDVDFRMVNTHTTEDVWDIGAAIYLAGTSLGAGDVILIEQQVWGPQANQLAPAEWVPSVYDAIRTATDKGVIVIEAAGNGGLDLDDPVFGTDFPLDKPDSGAIMIGAGARCGGQDGDLVPRARLMFSNYGERLDVQGYGECIVSAGGGSLYNGGSPNTLYTNMFGGTSSASALVAGVAAGMSSAYEQARGIAPGVQLIRDTLVTTGTPQSVGKNPGRIGPLVNMSAALAALQAASPVVVPSSVIVTEGDVGVREARIIVELSRVSSLPVTVQWTTADYTAEAPSDYLTASGTVTFPAGDTVRSVPINIIGDTVQEHDELALVEFSGATNATIGGFYGLGFVSILNDDRPVVTPGSAVVTEGASGTKVLEIPVALSKASTLPVTVQWSTADYTAIAPGDYVSASGTVTFAPGQASKTVSIIVKGDTLGEPDEIVLAVFSNATNATIGGFYGLGIGTIQDDDRPGLALDDASVVEGNSGTRNMTFTVSLTKIAASAVTASYATADGTALGAADYQARAGTLTILAGRRSATITVPIVGDSLRESNETFSVLLSAPSANARLADGKGTGTIRNDD